MENNIEWKRFSIKSFCRLKKSATGTFNFLQEPDDEELMSHVSPFRWYKSFIEGQEDVEGEHQPSRSCTEVLVNTASALVQEGLLISVRCSVKIFNNSYESAQIILIEDSLMKRVVCWWVLHLSSPDRMKWWTVVCLELAKSGKKIWKMFHQQYCHSRM